VNHIFMICLPLLCGRPEVFQGDSSFKVLQVTPFRVQGDLTLGCKCTCTLKHRKGQKTLHTLGLEASIATLKCHFVRPS